MAGNGHRGRTARFASRRLAGPESTELLRWLPPRPAIARLFLCLVAALLTVVATRGWRPQFSYRLGYTPQRDVRVATAFSVLDELETNRLRDEAARSVLWVFTNDPTPLERLVRELEADLRELAAAPTLEQLDDTLREDFGFRLPPARAAEQPAGPIAHEADGPAEPRTGALSPQQKLESQFKAYRDAVKTDDQRNNLRTAVERAVRPLQQDGILQSDQRQALEGKTETLDRINVRNLDDPPNKFRDVQVSDVTLDVLTSEGGRLRTQLQMPDLEPEVLDRTFRWLRNKLPPTLSPDDAAAETQRLVARENVVPVTTEHNLGDQIVPRGTPIGDEHLTLLALEHGHYLAGLSLRDQTKRFAASLGLVGVLFVLCALHIVRNEPEIARSMGRLAVLLGLVVVTVAASTVLNVRPLYAEVVPLVISVMILAIAYSLEFGLLMAFALSVIITQAMGGELGRFVILVGTTATAVLSVGKVRSRTKLTTVGFYSGFAYFALVWGTGILENQSIEYLTRDSFRGLLWGVAAGLIVTGLLPFVERLFGVVTDSNLLELADPAHPLFHELLQRAPGTYNHSVTVANLASHAADRIGANGLLVRVGAYFHDIGKMLKPHYFIENQSDGMNRHDSLAPAMSTLIIIGHVKDGADLAREHHLPEPIVDFIEQHHGTTLVEYFYHDATQHKDEPSYSNIEESAFRYPGPKPQTKEAGVLMLADCVESASRTLSEPTPARIERLVEELAMKLLLDGQFDESGLNLKEVRDVQDSLIKSLTAVYHGRIKYPQQRLQKNGAAKSENGSRHAVSAAHDQD